MPFDLADFTKEDVLNFVNSSRDRDSRYTAAEAVKLMRRNVKKAKTEIETCEAIAAKLSEPEPETREQLAEIFKTAIAKRP